MAILWLGGGDLALAQTTTTPGIPNTAGGLEASTNWTVLGLSGLAALAGFGYLFSRRRLT